MSREVTGHADQEPCWASKPIRQEQGTGFGYAGRRRQADCQASQQAGTQADKVQLSSEAKLRGAAYKQALESPDVRQRKIDELKERVRNGTYKPDIKKAAVNLIRDDLDLIR
ncbi:flagellar biosynthesis anti-sigma factor FlgM [Salidesulfovibrio brasiliensis]|uniref:flagellar biosynthesis anti-sigma factor FlgM n=1 Tax=Salidesulfovibrio brasiliensis TaxID=221711 RepID=UPI000AAFAFF0|nr:flagellar biosynthesis anti-sigma factor FlgM [Salidesulfovibrio brasiliensis]